MANFDVIEGNCEEIVQQIPNDFVDVTVTSTPYWNKRDYGHSDQIGRETTPDLFVKRLTKLFTEVLRITKPLGSLWINIDDTILDREILGIPWQLVFSLKQAGWHLRADAIWHKINSSPEPAKIRLSRTHEYLFHFTKVPQGYYFDMDSIREPHTSSWARDCIAKFIKNPVEKPKIDLFNKEKRYKSQKKGVSRAEMGSLMNPLGRNRRDVFTVPPLYSLKQDIDTEKLNQLMPTWLKADSQFTLIIAKQDIPESATDFFEPLRLDLTSVIATTTRKFRGEHFAPYPLELIEPFILATSPKGGLVLDPFCGTGTTGVAALRNDRNFLGLELVRESVELANKELSLCNEPPPTN